MVEIFGAPDGKTTRLLKRAERAVFKNFFQPNYFYVELSFVSEMEMQSLNSRTRGVDSVTDVLSFPALEKPNLPKKRGELIGEEVRGRVILGEIVICTERMLQQAEEYENTTSRECTYLFVHGMLHLLGFDHETAEDKALMRLNEENILMRIGQSRK